MTHKKVINFADMMADDQKLRSACSITYQLTSTTNDHIEAIFSALEGLVSTINPKKQKQAKTCFEQIIVNLSQIRDNCFSTNVSLRSLRGRDATEAITITRRVLAKMNSLYEEGKEYDVNELYQKEKREVAAEVNQ